MKKHYIINLILAIFLLLDSICIGININDPMTMRNWLELLVFEFIAQVLLELNLKKLK